MPLIPMKDRLLAAVLIALLCLTRAFASDDIEVGTRHVHHYQRPVLPEIARKMKLKGAVRLELDIAPNGKVTAVRALGGHPVLLDCATKAVRAWQFEAAAQATTGAITINFE